MKSIKIYLSIVSLMLLGAIGLGVYVWYTVQTLNTSVPVQNSGNENVSQPITS
jgi:hypothetical protein